MKIAGIFASALAALVLTLGARAQQPAPPGAFDYYLLALSWSPAYCADHRDEASARAQCSKRRGFVVHGLWPQDEDGSWPAFCRPVPPVPAALAAREGAIMPDAPLIEHEWEKHGSCTTDSAPDYFAALERAFGAIRLPRALLAPHREVRLSVADAKRLFTSINPGLTAAMISLRCQAGDRVNELRLCLDRSLRFRSCGAGEADACPASVRFAPVGTPGD